VAVDKSKFKYIKEIEQMSDDEQIQHFFFGVARA
jgi:hypothetical protein